MKEAACADRTLRLYLLDNPVISYDLHYLKCLTSVNMTSIILQLNTLQAAQAKPIRFV